ncbi:MAG: YbaK/EbsC family protein [Gammaproteobacteria bacterium]|nr:YbaK/EbsC family protein [Gammaproteobacteria bacterium]
MGIAITLREYLDQTGVPYDVLPHPYTPTSRRAAESAHIPPSQMAKSVMLEDDRGYVMAVVPATNRVELANLEKQLGRRLMLATERELDDVFGDCAKGAIPAIGQPYGVDVVWDDALSECSDVYFEAGDHEDLVHLRGKDFRSLMGQARHGRISRPAG